TTSRTSCRRLAWLGVTGPRRCATLLRAPPLARCVQRCLGRERLAELGQRAQQRVDLEQRVVSKRGRLDRELEVDLVHAIADPQLQRRRRQRVTRRLLRRRVLDEDADLRAAVELGTVEAYALVDASVLCAVRTPRVLQQVGHGALPSWSWSCCGRGGADRD